MEELYKIIAQLRLTEQRYNILIGYIKEALKDGYINTDKLTAFIEILENN